MDDIKEHKLKKHYVEEINKMLENSETDKLRYFYILIRGMIKG